MTIVALARARVWPALAALATLALAPAADAQPQADPPPENPPEMAPAAPQQTPPQRADPPYESWKGGYPYPPPQRPGAGPPPRLAVSEYGRRPVELVPSLLLLLPQCDAGTRSSDRCEGVGGGLALEFSALWRVSPYFAWGGTLAVGGLRYEPPSRLEIRKASAVAAFIGLLGRVYFIDEGSVDPYLELGLGGGAIGTTGQEIDDVTYDYTSGGPAVRAGAGIDFYMSRSLRLGPAVSATRLFVESVQRCESGGGSCVELPADDDGHLAGFFALGVKLTIMIGDEM